MLFIKIRIHSISNSVILRALPWLILFFTMSTGRIGVAKQAIVVAGLLAVGADVGGYLAAAAGLYPLAAVLSKGNVAGVYLHQQIVWDAGAGGNRSGGAHFCDFHQRSWSGDGKPRPARKAEYV